MDKIQNIRTIRNVQKRKRTMTKENRQKYIDVGLRMRNIELHPDLLKKVLEVVDLVDRKKGKSNIQDIIELENKK